MKLTRVTITGADDAVDPRALVAISHVFPFVEWGILCSEKREGQERYPTTEWRNRFNDALLNAYPPVKTASCHLCGALSRLAMHGDWSWLTEEKLSAFQRFQLNGFSQEETDLSIARVFPHLEFVLQVQTRPALVRAQDLSCQHSNVSVLWDRSGGRGTTELDWPDPAGLRIGYAGGIGPSNVEAVIREINAKILHGMYWIDMESGVRINDRFDLNRVWAVLAAAEPFVGGA